MSGRGARWVVVLATVVAALFVVPLLWPIPPLTDTVPPRQLADADSKFVEIDGIEVHYKLWTSAETSGPPEMAFVLLHGFGASTFSWRGVAEPLAATLPVVAFDRPGFGLTERPLSWSGPDPYSPSTHADLTLRLMDRLGIERAVLVGHSAGGTVAALIAERAPDRVAGVILEDPAIFAGGPPRFLTPLFRTPQMRRLGPLFARRLAGSAGDDFIRRAWHDPSKIGDEVYAGYRRPLRAEHWDQALWLLTMAPRPDDVPETVSRIEVPVLFMTGDDDRIVPSEDTERAAELVTGAELVIVKDCGHIPHEEQSQAFLDAVNDFLGTLPELAP